MTARRQYCRQLKGIGELMHTGCIMFSPLPYTEKDIVCVLQRGRCGEHAHAIGVDVVARVCQLMQRVVQRIIALLRRLCTSSAYCSRADVETAVCLHIHIAHHHNCCR
jgi:hypothetical protein